MADPKGPTGGSKLVRPSDGKEAKTSRLFSAPDRATTTISALFTYLLHGDLKQTHFVQEAWGDEGKSTIYYIDIRAIDRLRISTRKLKATPMSPSSNQRSPQSPKIGKTATRLLHGVDVRAMTGTATVMCVTPPNTIWWCWQSAWNRA